MIFDLDRRLTNHFDEKKYGPVTRVWSFPDRADPHNVSGSGHYPFLTYSSLSNISVSAPDLKNDLANFYASQIHEKRFQPVSRTTGERKAILEMALDDKIRLPEIVMFNETDFMFMGKEGVLASVRNAMQKATSVKVDKQTREESPAHLGEKYAALDYLLGRFCFYRVQASDYTAYVNARITVREKRTPEGLIQTYIFEKGFSDGCKGSDNEYHIVNKGVNKGIIQISDRDILNDVRSEKIPKQNDVPLKTKIGFWIGVAAIAGVAIGVIEYSTQSPQELRWAERIDSCGSDIQFYVDSKRKTADASTKDQSKTGSLYLVNNDGSWSVDWEQTIKINGVGFALGMAENPCDTGNKTLDTLLHLKSANDCKKDILAEVARKVNGE